MSEERNPYAPPESTSVEGSGRVTRRRYPWWVKLSLWGVPGRSGLWAFVLFSGAAALASSIYGFWDRRYMLLGIALMISALMYWLSIRWIDQHGTWGPET